MAAQIPWLRTNAITVPSDAADGLVELGAVTHGFGGDPDLVRLWAECVSAEHGYAIGDRILVPCALHPSPWHASEDTFYVYAAGAALVLVFNNDNGDGLLQARHKTTGVRVNLALSSWRFYLTAARFFVADEPPNGGIDPADAEWDSHSQGGVEPGGQLPT